MNSLLDKVSEIVPGILFELAFHHKDYSYFQYISNRAENILISIFSTNKLLNDKEWINIVHHQDKKRVEQNLWTTFKARSVWNDIFRLENKNSQAEHWIQVCALPKVQTNTNEIYMGLFIDISKRMNSNLSRADIIFQQKYHFDILKQILYQIQNIA
ncbi:MAG: PAS domain-containing protein [Bacteroidia bacterium]|nr:PAS domain-containing protein [Bacteroidia bacterium]MDW8158866.1 PAS domain-containing protein [Bacteroidia bacterium]